LPETGPVHHKDKFGGFGFRQEKVVGEKYTTTATKENRKHKLYRAPGNNNAGVKKKAR
jgi:hypothetical protein